MADTHQLNIPKQVSLRQASELWNIPLSSLRRLATKNMIPIRRVYGRIYIATEAFELFLKSKDVDVAAITDN